MDRFVLSLALRIVCVAACVGSAISALPQVDPVFSFGRSVGFLHNFDLSADGSKIVTISSRGSPSVKLWRTGDLAFVHRVTAPPDGTAYGVAFSPDGRRVAYTGASGIGVRLADVDTGVEAWRVSMYAGYAVTFHPAGDRVYAGGAFGSCYELRATDGVLLRNLSIGTSSSVYALDISRDGRYMAMGYAVSGGEGWAKVIDLQTGSTVGQFGIYGRSVGHVRFTPDGSYLFLGESPVAGRVIVVRTSNWSVVNSFAAHPGGTWAIAPIPGRNEILTAGADTVIRRWTFDGTLIDSYPGHDPYTSLVQCSPDGTKLYSGGPDGRLVSREIESGTLLKEAIGHTSVVAAADLSPDHALVAAGGDGSTAEILVWETGTAELRFRLAGHTSMVWALEFSPDGAILASGGGDRKVKIWAVSNGALLHELTFPNPVQALTFNPSGDIVASGGPVGVALIDPATGVVTRTITETGNPTSVRFSPDGSILCVGSADGVRVYDTDTWQRIAHLTGHNSTIRGLAFSPDGEYLFTSGQWEDELQKWSTSDWTLEWSRSVGTFWSVRVVNGGKHVLLQGKVRTPEPTSGAIVSASDGTLLFDFSTRFLQPLFTGAHRDSSVTAVGSLDQLALVWHIPTTLPWSALTITKGVLESGGLASLDSRDDDRLVLQARRPSEIAAASAEVELESVVPNDRRKGISIVIESASTNEPVTERLELFNYTTKQWDVVGEWASSGTDSSRAVNVRAHAQYIDPASGRLRARLGFYDRGVTSAGWTARIDLFLLVAS